MLEHKVQVTGVLLGCSAFLFRSDKAPKEKNLGQNEISALRLSCSRDLDETWETVCYFEQESEREP